MVPSTWWRPFYAHREKGQREQGKAELHMLSPNSELDFLVHLVMWWIFKCHESWLTSKWQLKSSKVVNVVTKHHIREYWESHVKQTWSCPLWASDREDKRRQLLCIIPKFSHGNAAKIRAQHAAITPMHGLGHIPWSNIFHAIKMCTLWPRLTRYHEL